MGDYEEDTRSEASAHFSTRQELKAERIMRQSRERTISSLHTKIAELEAARKDAIEDAFIAGRRHQMEADAQIVDNQYERDGYIVQYDAAEAIREQEIENR